MRPHPERHCHCTCRGGYAETVDALLGGSASLDQPDSDGTTPLMHTCICSSTAVVMKLLAAGASVVTTDAGGTTALMFAATCADSAPLILLLRWVQRNDCTALLNETDAVDCRWCIRAERFSQLQLPRTYQQGWVCQSARTKMLWLQ